MSGFGGWLGVLAFQALLAFFRMFFQNYVWITAVLPGLWWITAVLPGLWCVENLDQHHPASIGLCMGTLGPSFCMPTYLHAYDFPPFSPWRENYLLLNGPRFVTKVAKIEAAYADRHGLGRAVSTGEGRKASRSKRGLGIG